MVYGKETQMSKKCARCKQLKPLEAFAFHKNARDKKQSYCQDCMTESRQIRYANKIPPSLERDQLNKYKKKWLMIPSNKEASKMRIRNSLIVSRLSTNPDSVKDDTIINNFGVEKNVFMNHLQSLFEKGMSWKNYGAWHLDHIVGLIKFNLTKESQKIAANHYSNIRPIWGTKNLKRKKKN